MHNVTNAGTTDVPGQTAGQATGALRFIAALRQTLHPALLPAVIFLLLALGLILHWRAIGKYLPTGDEPHYMVIANSLTRYHGFETTAAYRDMFRTLLLPFPGQPPTPQNTHGVAGPHGLFSEHNIGLPILIAIPLRLSGLLGVRLLMALMASGVAVLAYGFAGFYTQDRRLRMLLAVALACVTPYLPAAGQIYPDLPAGLLFGLALLCLSRGALGQRASSPSQGMPLLAAAAIAFAPWLQIKFAAASVLAAIGCVCWADMPRRAAPARIGIFALPLLVSLAILAAYNRYAFGSMSGPYESGALVANWHALMVLMGLHLDQFQGIFFLDPMLLLAPIGAAALVRRRPGFGIYFILLYASLVVPNAMHTNWYGGGGFAARFVLSGSVLLILPAAYAMRVLRMAPRVAAGLCIVSLCVQAAYYATYRSQSFSLYNQPDVPFIESYVTLFGRLQKYLPEFCNIDFAYRYLPNYGWLAGLVVLLVIGWHYARTDGGVQHRPRRHLRLAWASAALLPLSGSVAAAFWQPPITRILAYEGANLPGLTGHAAGSSRVAIPGQDRPTFLSFGPYVSLPKGRYRFELVYSSTGGRNQHVGDWDIVSNSGTEPLSGPSTLNGTDGKPATIAGMLNIGSLKDGHRVEIRTTFAGVAPMTIERINIEKSPAP